MDPMKNQEDVSPWNQIPMKFPWKIHIHMEIPMEIPHEHHIPMEIPHEIHILKIISPWIYGSYPSYSHESMDL